MTKPLKSWMSNNQTQYCNDWVAQDRFLDMNYFSYIDHLEQMFKNGVFYHSKENSIRLLEVNETSRIRDVLMLVHDRLIQDEYQDQPFLDFADPHDILYDILIRPFLEYSKQKQTKNFKTS